MTVETDSLPCDLDAERAVLGAVILGGNAPAEVAAILTPAAFHDLGHRAVYRAAQALVDAGQAIDVVTLRAELLRHGVGDAVISLSALAAFTDAVPSAANAAHYAERVRDCWVRRRIIAVGREMELIGEREGDGAAAMGAVGQALDLLDTETEPRQVAEPIAGMLLAALDGFGPEHSSVLRTGWHNLDAVIGGFDPGDLVIIGARPSVGKTALMVNLMIRQAVREQVPWGLITLETDRVTIVRNALCALAGISTLRLLPGQVLGRVENDRIVAAAGEMEGAPIYIADPPSATIDDVRAIARSMHRRWHIRVLGADYVQLVRGRRGHSDQRYQEIGEVSAGLRATAKELGIAVVATAQLGRAVDARDDRVPRLSDLRESGNLEQDADQIWLIRRSLTQPSEATITVAKNKRGRTDSVPMTFRGEFLRFTDVEEATDA